MRIRCLLFLLAGAAQAQLIPNGSPIPRTAKPPVVFLNGYEASCSGSTFAGTFGKFDQFLQAAGRTTLFFDNCTFSGKPSIEDLGNSFRDYLATLKYADAGQVTAVDVVVHSMGGLIVRSYLAGKQNTAGVFQPPANVAIRKAVFLATPNFGSPIVGLAVGGDAQTKELANGSVFSFDLATWNQGTDDLRGVDALALAGNGGTGLAVTKNFDDGVVSLTSASIGFARPARTRVVPYCHTGPGLVTIGGLCPAGVPGIAEALNAGDANVTATISFLNDTNDWQSVGQAAEQNPLLMVNGGLVARAESTAGQFVGLQSAKSTSKDLNVNGAAVAWTEQLPAQAQTVTLTTATGAFDAQLTLPAGYVTPLIVKPGAFIYRVFPAAAILSPLAVAPGMFVSIYGTGFVGQGMQASSLPLPTSLGGVQILLNGVPIPLQYVGPTQVNAIIPAAAQGLVTLTYSANSVLGTVTSQTINVLVQPAVPAIFSQDQSGAGPAAALDAVTNALVTSSAPLHPGGYVSLFLTGLGAVQTQNGLPYAAVQPTVTVGGKACTVSYAGRAPGFDGLDQINCQLALDVAPSVAAPVVVTSGGRASNAPTLAIQ
jgi:uncharacterized protein (TIGR03437 family)